MQNPSFETLDVNLLGDTSQALWAVQHVQDELSEKHAEQLRNKLFRGWLEYVRNLEVAPVMDAEKAQAARLDGALLFLGSQSRDTYHAALLSDVDAMELYRDALTLDKEDAAVI